MGKLNLLMEWESSGRRALVLGSQNSHERAGGNSCFLASDQPSSGAGASSMSPTQVQGSKVFGRCLLLSQAISLESALKQNSQDLKQHPCGMLVPQVKAYLAVLQCQPQYIFLYKCEFSMDFKVPFCMCLLCK